MADSEAASADDEDVVAQAVCLCAPQHADAAQNASPKGTDRSDCRARSMVVFSHDSGA